MPKTITVRRMSAVANMYVQQNADVNPTSTVLNTKVTTGSAVKKGNRFTLLIAGLSVTVLVLVSTVTRTVIVADCMSAASKASV